jgi:hypothetical protein
MHLKESLMNRILAIAVCCLCVGSNAVYAQSKAEAEKLAAALKGDNAGTAADNRQCKMFTKAEAGQYIGQVVDHVENAAVGTGCQWSSSGKDGSVLVQVVPARYHEKPSAGAGYKKLPDVGTQAFVIPELGGWHAGSLNGPRAVHVIIRGKGASEAKAVELLKESMKRDAALPAK